MIRRQGSICLKSITFNPFGENTYLLWDDETKDGVIFDPGCSDSQEEFELSSYVLEQKIHVKAVINTHCHLDHVWGNPFVIETWGCPFFAPELELPLLRNARKQGQSFGLILPDQPEPDSLIREEGLLEFGSIKLRSIFTPGHAPGEYCFLVEGTEFLIAGDVLFEESIGRTDLPGGNHKTLIASIKEKLFTLPDSTEIFPGHGNSTTIRHEKAFNPFLT
ncbi:MAG: MBL fold metallo-hydrolase [Ignavibacteriales bacterium]|nr:MAG: MBL fold metallo-hydrolase [Ignavibacteriales bacterium]